MRVLVIGAGAVGGYVAVRLIEGGAAVRILARGSRASQVYSKGLQVVSPLGDALLRVEAPEATERFDIIVLACKAFDLEGAVDAVRPFIQTDTRILPLLNGVRHVDWLRHHLSGNRLFGGIVHGALSLREDGAITHASPFFSTIVGGLSDPDCVAAEFVGTLGSAGVQAHGSDNILQDMWNKFVFLTTLSGITCLMRGSIGDILQVSGGEAAVTHLLRECSSVADAEGFPSGGATMAGYEALLTQQNSSLTSSMLRDVRTGRRTEWEHILADMLARAGSRGIPAPLLSLAVSHLQVYECQLSGRAIT